MTANTEAAPASAVQFGLFAVPVRHQQTPHALVPQLADTAEFEGDETLEMLAYAIERNVPALMVGDTGTGKTSAARWIAAKCQIPYRRINLSGSTTAEELVGKTLLRKEGTYWADGVLTQAMREGWMLVLDEINAAPAEVLFVLQSLLDDDRMIALADKEGGEIVRPHPDFRLVCTMNPSDGEYAGTRELNRALMSRFEVVIEVDYLPAAKEAHVVAQRGGVPAETASRMVSVAEGIRKSTREGKSSLMPSTRDLLAWGRVTAAVGDPLRALNVTLAHKATSRDDREALRSVARLQFGQAQRPLDHDALVAAVRAAGGDGAYFKLAGDLHDSENGLAWKGDTIIHVVPASCRATGCNTTREFDADMHIFVAAGKVGGPKRGGALFASTASYAGALIACGKPSGFDEEEINH